MDIKTQANRRVSGQNIAHHSVLVIGTGDELRYSVKLQTVRGSCMRAFARRNLLINPGPDETEDSDNMKLHQSDRFA